MQRIKFIFILFCLMQAQAQAQDFLESSLEDMIGSKTTIATRRELTTRESPGIVTLVSRDEIVRSGARDLQEILELLVPGTYVGAEIEGVSGIGFRGIWAFDSRMLLMLDGMEVNEDVFGSAVFGNRFPAEMIERVEVIRGPGSVIYGGYAAVGVVNVITRGAGRDGFALSGRYSQMSKTYSHRNGTASGAMVSGEFRGDVTVSGGEGQRGEGTQYDVSGGSGKMDNNMDIDPQVYNLGVKYKGFQARAMMDYMRTTYLTPGWAGISATERPYLETFRTYATQLKYDWDVNPRLRITPKFDFKRTEPWKIRDLDPVPANYWEFAKKSERRRGGVSADWTIAEGWSLLSGVEYDSLVVSHLDSADYDPDVPRIKNDTRIIYAEGTWTSGLGQIVLGGRYESPLIVNSAFVPRLAWTKVWDKFHGKALIAQSFRSPTGIQPARTVGSNKLGPEIVTNIEFEAGYQMTKNSWFVGNIFDIKVDDALVYRSGVIGTYLNDGKIGSRGFELEYRYRGPKFDINSNIAYYRSIATSVGNLQVGQDGLNRGAPAIRANAQMGYKFSDNFGIYPGVAVFSQRWGQTRGGSIKEFDSAVITNLIARYQNLFTKGLQISGGVMNLLDTDLPMVQGYDNDVADIPSNQRAINVMISYEL